MVIGAKILSLCKWRTNHAELSGVNHTSLKELLLNMVFAKIHREIELLLVWTLDICKFDFIS